MTATVVVPLFNRIDLTIGCVSALNRESPEVQTVLVDNGSTDLTRDMAVEVRNHTNLGFARACNLGAMMANHPVIVFLNNDTEVGPGWLQPLLASFDDDRVGIAGARLIYPGGAVQHAGVSVDFTRPPGREAVNITHDLGVGAYDVAAVTGACMAIRAQLFRDLGGFDPEFWNGYEDIDLCLRAGRDGWLCRYEPASVVTHYESQSGPERWTGVRRNVQLLRERWGAG